MVASLERYSQTIVLYAYLYILLFINIYLIIIPVCLKKERFFKKYIKSRQGADSCRSYSFFLNPSTLFW